MRTARTSTDGAPEETLHTSTVPTTTQIAIIGTGFSGLGMAIRLRERGIRDFILLERAEAIGGTWRDNSYPGCACDVESHLYSFSFALNPDWTHAFSGQDGIRRYLEQCAERYDVLRHVHFGCDVESAEWGDSAQRWKLETSRGVVMARVVVMASGPLSDPVTPALPGLERFRGRSFHSGRWDHQYDLHGKRVAVIGTGASAIQFVPRIQPVVAALHVFQRTPPWILPRPGGAIGERRRRLYRRLPFAMKVTRAAIYLRHESFLLMFRHLRVARRIERLAHRHLRRAVKDPALREKLTPRYAIGCKRVLLTNDYLPAIVQPNVELVTDGIAEVREHSIVGRDGVERPVDAIIFGTGFRPTAPPLADHVRGRTGETLTEAWQGSPKALAGVSVTGFPNFFLLLGPNSGLGHSSVVYMVEAQIAHIVQALRHLERSGAAVIEARAEAQAAYVEAVDRRMRGTVWVAGGCRSWYLDATGRNSTLWPDFTWRYRRRIARVDPAEYELRPAARAQPVLEPAR